MLTSKEKQKIEELTVIYTTNRNEWFEITEDLAEEFRLDKVPQWADFAKNLSLQKITSQSLELYITLSRQTEQEAKDHLFNIFFGLLKSLNGTQPLNANVENRLTKNEIRWTYSGR